MDFDGKLSSHKYFDVSKYIKYSNDKLNNKNMKKAIGFIKEIDKKEGSACWSDDQDMLPMYMEKYAELYYQDKVKNVFPDSSKKSIFELEEDRFKWSSETFPEASAIGSLQKLKEEVAEIEVNITDGERDVMEYADCLMCLFDSARRQKDPITIQEIFDAFEQKLEINKGRIWEKNNMGSYSHVKK